MGRDGTAMGCVGVLLVIRSDQGFFSLCVPSIVICLACTVYCVTVKSCGNCVQHLTLCAGLDRCPGRVVQMDPMQA